MNEEEVINAFLSFSSAMCQWEIETASRFKRSFRREITQDDAKAESIVALKQIFDAHCAYVTVPARARYGTIAVAMAPTYGVEHQQIRSVEVSNDRARVVTEETAGLRRRLVYHLQRAGQAWKLEDNRKRITSNGDEVDWDL